MNTVIRMLTSLLLLSVIAACGGDSNTPPPEPPPPVRYTITTSVTGEGTITPSQITVNAGSSTSFAITPAEGWQIKSVSGCNGNLSGTTYNITNINANCVVVVVFEPIPPTEPVYLEVTGTAETGGTITPSLQLVQEGTTATLSVEADDLYEIDTVEGCGAGTLVDDVYTTAPVTEDCEVIATFKLLPVFFDVTGSAEAGGSITPTLQSIQEGHTATLTVVVDELFEIDTVEGCGAGTLVDDVYTTAPVTEDCEVIATFKRLPVIMNNFKLNDTGSKFCTTANEFRSTEVDCSEAGRATGVAVPEGQDALYGRDVTDNDDSDGYAGFSFSKIAADGSLLSNDASEWSCVRDNVTQLVWEVNTDTPGSLHEAGQLFSWYDPDTSNNGGNEGTVNNGVCNIDSCDSHSFTLAVNEEALCGITTWRVPSKEELRSILVRDLTDDIMTNFFPVYPRTWYWTSTTQVAGIDRAFFINFGAGFTMSFEKHNALLIRLVSDEPVGGN